MDVSLSSLRELVMDREAWRAAVHGVTRDGHDWATELNITNTIPIQFFLEGIFFQNWIRIQDTSLGG